jgi:hypothetical protein
MKKAREVGNVENDTVGSIGSFCKSILGKEVK